MTPLSERAALMAAILRPEAVVLYSNEVEQLTDALVNHVFRTSPAEMIFDVQAFVNMQAERTVYARLLENHRNAVAQLPDFQP